MRRSILIALLFAIGCNRHGASGDAVADRLKKAVSDALPGSTLRMTPDDILLVQVGTDSSPVELTLDNIRRNCASSEIECASAIDNVVETTKKIFQLRQAETNEAPLDRTKIRLTPKPTEWLDEADAHKGSGNAEETRVVRQKFVGDLWWLYVVDEPAAMRIINSRDLQDLGMTVEQLHSLAVANLAAEYPKLELDELAHGLWALEPGDYLDSARLALVEQWRAEAKKRGGTLIASVPARSSVFVTNDPAQRAALETTTKRAFAEGDHPLSQVILVWTDDGWKAER